MENQSSEVLQPFDPTKFVLGTICARGHDWNGTGKSLRRIKRVGGCVICKKDADRARNAKNMVARQAQKNLWRLRNPEAAKRHRDSARQRKIDRDGHEAVNLEQRQRYAENRAARLLAKRLDRLANLPLYRQLGRENSKKYAAKRKLWRRSDSGRRSNQCSQQKRRRHKFKAHSVDYSSADLALMFQRFNNECVYCGDTKDQAVGKKSALTIDHFLPLSVGGTDNMGNLTSACFSCNASKCNSDPFIWYQQQPFFSKKRWQTLLKLMGKTAENYNQLPLL